MTPAFSTKETSGQHTRHKPPTDFTGLLPHSSLPLLTLAIRVPPHSLHPAPTRALNLHRQPAQASVAVGVQGANLEPPQLTHTTVCALRARPSSCALAHWGPDTHHQPSLACVHLWQHPIAVEVHTDSQGLCSCLWAWIWPCLLSLAPLGSPAARPSICAPVHLQPFSQHWSPLPCIKNNKILSNKFNQKSIYQKLKDIDERKLKIHK